MERFCDELRWERERQQISIEKICAVTKVAHRHVQALEAGEYSALPGGVFRKGILRNYLSVLELDETSWIERFEEALRASGKLDEQDANWSEFAENIRRNRGGNRQQTAGRWVGVFAMVTTLIVLGWVVWRFVLAPHFAA